LTCACSSQIDISRDKRLFLLNLATHPHCSRCVILHFMIIWCNWLSCREREIVTRGPPFVWCLLSLLLNYRCMLTCAVCQKKSSRKIQKREKIFSKLFFCWFIAILFRYIVHNHHHRLIIDPMNYFKQQSHRNYFS
jgi:hypothetical protein